MPNAVDVLGVAKTDATVTVNSQSTYRKGEFFHKALSVANASAAVNQSVTVSATSGGTVSKTGTIFVPPATEAFTHDLDGNLTSDARWNYTWDAENRLVRLTGKVAGVQPTQSDYEYDWRGRRIKKVVAGATTVSTKFLYDGWNMVAGMDGSDNLLRGYMWGLDLSGSIEGAGGVGGLVAAILTSGGGAHFYSYDGNGNVVALIKSSDASVSSAYEYGAFGETARSFGSLANFNRFRFSTKFTDDESDFPYYGKRYFNSLMGKWLSRDPANETGGENLTAFLGNDAISKTDYLGLFAELWYGNHPVGSLPVLGQGSHSKLWLITDEGELINHPKYGTDFRPAISKTEIVLAPSPDLMKCQMAAITMGAGPDDVWGSPEELIASFDREKDYSEKLFNNSLISVFHSAQEAIQFLDSVDRKNKVMNSNFIRTTLEYEFFPDPSYTSSGWDEFNSNSYVAGLLSTFGSARPWTPGWLPGWSKPVPDFVFTTRFSNTAQLREAWKAHHPNF